MQNSIIDLFGDVVVTHQDISIYLYNMGLGTSSKPRREYYAQWQSIAIKIKSSKIDGSFEKLITRFYADRIEAETPLDLYATKYKDEYSDKPKPCPNHWHICENLNCEVRKKRIRSARNRRYLANAKAKKIKADKAAARAIKKAQAADLAASV